jgi:hypothetical protein
VGQKKAGIAALVCPPIYPGIPELEIPPMTIEAVIHPLPGS